MNEKKNKIKITIPGRCFPSHLDGSIAINLISQKTNENLNQAWYQKVQLQAIEYVKRVIISLSKFLYG